MACCQVGSRSLALHRSQQHCSSTPLRMCLYLKSVTHQDSDRGGFRWQEPVSFSAGEEVVTKESFVSVCWRLIPYWLNNWEQQWGAECSSMMFELPHFAIELLVVLPCVQVRPIGLETQQLLSLLCLHQPLSDCHGEGPQTCSSFAD